MNTLLKFCQKFKEKACGACTNIKTGLAYEVPPILRIGEQMKKSKYEDLDFWQGRQDSNLQPTVLETATLPIALLPYERVAL